MIDYSLLYNISMSTNGKKIWYYAEKTGYVMELDIASGRMECLFYVPNTSAYRVMCYCDNSLYILPFYSNIMYVYDLKSKKTLLIILNEKDHKCCCTGCVFFEKEIYIYGIKSFIYKYNPEEKRISKIIDLQNQKMNMPNQSDNINWIWTQPIIYESRLYFLLYQNGMIVIDQRDNISYLSLGTGYEPWMLRNVFMENGLIRILYSDTKLNIKSMIYDIHGNIIDFKKVDIGYYWKIYPYLNSGYTNKGWVIFPYMDNIIRYIDNVDGKIKLLFDGLGKSLEKDREYYSAPVKVSGICEYLFLIDLYNSTLLKINTQTFEVGGIDLFFDEVGLSNFTEIMKNKIKIEKQIAYEKSVLETLETYIDII